MTHSLMCELRFVYKLRDPARDTSGVCFSLDAGPMEKGEVKLHYNFEEIKSF